MDRNDHEDTFLTVADVAQMLKLNQQTVRNWIDQGSLPALRVGRRVRIKRSDFERVLAAGYNAGGGSALHEAGPSAEDFWGGEPVGVAEPDPADGVTRADRATASPSVSPGNGAASGARTTAPPTTPTTNAPPTTPTTPTRPTRPT